MKAKISIALVLLAGVFWGSSAIFVNKLSELGFSNLQICSIRVTFAVPLLHAILISKGVKNYKLKLKTVGIIAFCGVFSVLAMCVCYFYAILETTPATAAVLLYTAPIFVMIMSVIFFKERMTAKKTLCLSMAVIGCALTSGIIGGIQGSVIGIIIGLLSGFTYSLYSIISTVVIKQGASPLACTAISFTFAAIAAQIITSPVDIVTKISASPEPFIMILGLIFFSICTCVIPFLLYTLGLSNLKPEVAAILASTEPVVAAIVGVAVLNKSINGFQITGIIFVLAAITILNLKNKKSSVN